MTKTIKCARCLADFQVETEVLANPDGYESTTVGECAECGYKDTIEREVIYGTAGK